MLSAVLVELDSCGKKGKIGALWSDLDHYFRSIFWQVGWSRKRGCGLA